MFGCLGRTKEEKEKDMEEKYVWKWSMSVCRHRISPPPEKESLSQWVKVQGNRGVVVGDHGVHFILRPREEESLDATTSTFSCHKHSSKAPGCFLGTWGRAGVNYHRGSGLPGLRQKSNILAVLALKAKPAVV